MMVSGFSGNNHILVAMCYSELVAYLDMRDDVWC